MDDTSKRQNELQTEIHIVTTVLGAGCLLLVVLSVGEPKHPLGKFRIHTESIGRVTTRC